MALLIKGYNLFYTPKQYGGGKDKAKFILEEALKKFEQFKPVNSFSPSWGEKEARALMLRLN